MSEVWNEGASDVEVSSGRGRGRGGFGSRGGLGSSNDYGEEFGGGGRDGDDQSSGFRGRGRRVGRGGYGRSDQETNGDDEDGGGSRKRGGGRGGFERRDQDNGDGGGSGFGGGRGGFRRRDQDDGDGGGSGFGGGRGGFRRRDQDDGDGGGRGGFRRRGQDDGDGGGRGGFRRRGQDDGGGSGFSGGRGGFRRRDQENGDDNEENGLGGHGGGGGRRDQNEDEGESSGFSGRGRGRGGGRGGRRERDDGEEGGEPPARKTELYIPPAPPDDEDSLFATMAAGINFDKYDEISVESTGIDPPKNISSFEECGFFETTMRNIKHCNYTKPTPVQKYAIPIINSGRDLMACAQTGSGKTAAFLLPVITRLLQEGVQGASQGDQQSPQVLIISPTRELTMQIYGEARKFVHESIYRPVVIYGGTSVGHQLRQLESGCNILVGTPGRLVDFLNRKKVLLEELKVLILDEADRMLDMGFEAEVRRVVEQFGMPPKENRQTLMFSATFPAEIQQLAAEFLHNHIFLTVGVIGSTTSDIQQDVVEVDEYQKREKLQEILSESGSDRVLVFVETKRNADFLASFLSQENFPTTSIHGDRFQREREEALRDFRSGRSRVLVATSVAARGLDIPKVKHVVNYDLPNNIEDYVHRIGRTGRIGNKGKATAFFQKDRDTHLARSLVKVLAGAQQEVQPFLEQAAEEAVGSNYGPAGGKFASKDIRFQGGSRRGNQGDSVGFGDGDRGGFGGFSEVNGGGFMPSGGDGNDEDW